MSRVASANRRVKLLHGFPCSSTLPQQLLRRKTSLLSDSGHSDEAYTESCPSAPAARRDTRF